MLTLAALILAPLPLGTYFVGTGSGDNNTLTLKEGGRYDYRFDGCFGGGESSGTYFVTGDFVTLDPQPTVGDRKALAPKLAIVPWGERTFLVAPFALGGFCAAYRKGWRGRDNVYDGAFLRDGFNREAESPEIAPAGVPLVPPLWRPLLKKPIVAKVLAVKGSECRIDLGEADGIAAGSAFGTEDSFIIVRETKAHEATGGWGTLHENKPSDFRPGKKLEVADNRFAYSVKLFEEAHVIGMEGLVPKRYAPISLR